MFLSKRFLLKIVTILIMVSCHYYSSFAQTKLCIRDQNEQNTIQFMVVGLQKKDTIWAENGCINDKSSFRDKRYKLILTDPILGQNKGQFFFRRSEENFIGIDSFINAAHVPVSYLNGTRRVMVYVRQITSHLNPQAKKIDVSDY